MFKFIPGSGLASGAVLCEIALKRLNRILSCKRSSSIEAASCRPSHRCARQVVGSVAAIGIILLFSSTAFAIECGWVQSGARYCSAGLSISSQTGYTVGTPFVSGNDIDDQYTAVNARKLKPGDNDIFVDRFNMCRYLGNSGGQSLFVPVATTGEWSNFLDGAPTGVRAVACAREIAGAASSPCGAVQFTWKRGKQGDTQISSFSFTRSQDWVLTKPQSYRCNCKKGVTDRGLPWEACDSCWQCVDTSTKTTTTCTAALTRKANATGSGAGSSARAQWVESSEVASADCTPPSPSGGSTSAVACTADSLVCNAYSILGRAPEATGDEFWNNYVSDLRSQGVSDNVIQGMLNNMIYGSVEYRDKTGQDVSEEERQIDAKNKLDYLKRMGYDSWNGSSCTDDNTDCSIPK